MRLIALLALAVGLRFFSFFPSVMDHDESTYLVIADEMLKGRTYWKDVSDTKPPGIFLIYAGLIALAGKSLFLIRLLVALWVGFTAWGIWRIARLWMPQGPGPWLAAVSWLVMTSIFTFFGVSPNAELFFAGLSVWALWLLLAFPWHGWAMAGAGLLLGLGIAVKQLAAFDALAMGIFFLAWILREDQDRLRRLGLLALMSLVSLLPFGAIAWWYHDRGLGETWYFHQFVLPGRYPESMDLTRRLKFIADFFLRFAPFTLLALLAVRHWRHPLGLLTLWMGCATLAILLPGNFFGHYTIQWMPPLALLCGLALDSAHPLPARLSALLTPRNGWFLLSAVLLLNATLQFRDYYRKPDNRRQALDLILAAEKEESDTTPIDVYTGDVSYQILYFLLNSSPPVEYPHPSLIWEAEHQENIDHTPKEELTAMYAHPPEYVLFSQRRPNDAFHDFLRRHYAAMDTLPDKVVLYRHLN